MKQIKPLLIIFLMIFLFVSQGSGQDNIRNDLPKGAKACLGKEKVKRIIRDIAYSPDGTQFAVATSKGIWLYDTDTYQIRFQLTEHSGEVYTLAFSPDGQVLASGGQDKTIRLWNPHTGKNLSVFSGHANGIAFLVFSIDGLTLASMSWRDAELRVWDVKTDQSDSTFVNMPPDAYPIAFSPDVQTLAIREKSDTIQLWDTKTTKYKTTLTGHAWEIDGSWVNDRKPLEPGSINCVTFSSDSKILASGSDDSTIRLWDTKKGEHKATLIGHQARVYSITFSPDGKTLASGDGFLPGLMFRKFFINNRENSYESQDPIWRFLRYSHPNYGDSEPAIRVWDAKTGKHRATIKIPITADLLEFAPDNETLASVDFNSVIRIWDTKTGKQKAFLTNHKPGIYATFTDLNPIISPDGGKVIYRNKDRTIQMWDMTNGKQTTLLKDNLYSIGFFVFSPDCETVAISNRHNRVIQLWNLKTDLRKAIFTGNMHWDNYGNPTFAFSPDGRYAAFASNQMVRLFNTKTGKQMATLTIASARPILKFSPNSKTIATRGQDRDMVQLWNTETGHAEVLLMTTQPGTSSVVFSPDGKYIINESYGNPSALWCVETGKQIINFHELHQNFTSLIFSPDGKTLAGIISVSPQGKVDKKTIWLLDTETGKHKITITTPIEEFEQILFSPDGATLVSKGQDATIRLWDTKTGKHKTAITEHVGGIEKILFSSDGATLVSEGRDATIRLWDTKTVQQKATLTEFTAKAPIVLSPDGKILANGGKGSAVHVRNLETGKLITTFTGYKPAKKIVFVKDDKTLITIENDGKTLLWNLPQ